MAWRIEFLSVAKRQLKKLDRQWQARILDYFDSQILKLQDPRSRGKALTGNKQGLWRYRVENYRIICDIEDDKLCIVALEIGHRSEIYKD